MVSETSKVTGSKLRGLTGGELDRHGGDLLAERETSVMGTTFTIDPLAAGAAVNVVGMKDTAATAAMAQGRSDGLSCAPGHVVHSRLWAPPR